VVSSWLHTIAKMSEVKLSKRYWPFKSFN